MAKQEYFQSALADFAFDMASGGAIRHLADQGYTAQEIIKMLDFPTPHDRIVQTMRKHFFDTGVLLTEEPGQGKQARYTWVTEYDRYSKKTFRRVPLETGGAEAVIWKQHFYRESADGTLWDFLARKCAQNGEETSYVSCDFGLLRYREPEHFSRAIARLSERHQNYIRDIFTERKLLYHRLDRRMREIIPALHANGDYHGTCYFQKLQESLTFACRNDMIGGKRS